MGRNPQCPVLSPSRVRSKSRGIWQKPFNKDSEELQVRSCHLLDGELTLVHGRAIFMPQEILE